MPDPQRRLSDLSLQISLTLLLAVVAPLLAGWVILAVGGSLTPLGARIGLVVCLPIVFGAPARAYPSAWRLGIAISAAILVLAIAASWAVIDTSYDGQSYHLDALMALKAGWNPTRADYVIPAAVAPVAWLWPWPAYYPIGLWTGQATSHIAGLPLEAAKYQGLTLIASVLFAVFGLGRRLSLKPLPAVLLAAAAAANPVCLAEAFTRMNDGVFASLAALALTYGVLWLFVRDRRGLIGLALALVLGLNLKFSTVPILAVLLAGLTLAVWVRDGLTPAVRAGLVIGLVSAFAILAIGFHPFVTNMRDHGHPFYPVMGKGKVDLMAKGSIPAGLVGKPPPVKLALALISRTDDHIEAVPQPKIPFTVTKDELWASGEPDTRLSGFGPLFSGALVLAIAAFAWRMGSREPGRPRALLALAVGTVLASVMIISEGWWARFTPQFWLAPVFCAAAALLARKRGPAALGLLLCAALLADSAIVAAYGARRAIPASHEVRAQLHQMGADGRPWRLYVGDSHARWIEAGDLGIQRQASRVPLSQACPGWVELAKAYADDGPEPSACPIGAAHP